MAPTESSVSQERERWANDAGIQHFARLAVQLAKEQRVSVQRIIDQFSSGNMGLNLALMEAVRAIPREQRQVSISLNDVYMRTYPQSGDTHRLTLKAGSGRNHGTLELVPNQGKGKSLFPEALRQVQERQQALELLRSVDRLGSELLQRVNRYNYSEVELARIGGPGERYAVIGYFDLKATGQKYSALLVAHMGWQGLYTLDMDRRPDIPIILEVAPKAIAQLERQLARPDRGMDRFGYGHTR